ncbi:hypothetical protein LL14B4_10110 [Lactococcus lactis subsp. lactis]|uniref:Uncharacterized protein n=1 Tax=Lactococcus lactis subsp. lactis TaxID=1360 RepID=A0A2Z3KGG9_LACLL|nr:hypothetical protein [Lactococcus lactis]AWN66506.1 hypothetical protein LL14B4_10110 [Lactococcus lactis subsp. lactis]
MKSDSIFWKNIEHNVNSIKVQEEFFFGKRRVRLVNPIYVDFDKTSCDIYKEMFEDLAGVSRDFYALENKLNSLNYQKVLVNTYLEENSVSKVAKNCNLSYTTVSELKRRVRSIDKLSLENFEKLFTEATKKNNLKKNSK